MRARLDRPSCQWRRLTGTEVAATPLNIVGKPISVQHDGIGLGKDGGSIALHQRQLDDLKEVRVHDMEPIQGQAVSDYHRQSLASEMGYAGHFRNLLLHRYCYRIR